LEPCAHSCSVAYELVLELAIHDLLHPNRIVNAAVGRMLSVMFGSPFQIVRASHLLHHKVNRAPIEGTEYYEPGERSFLGAAAGYYSQIVVGLYLAEVISTVLFFLPKTLIDRIKERFAKPASVSAILIQSWTQRPVLNQIRTDGALIVLWLGLSLFCYGDEWPLLLMVLGARGFLISFLDNVYHYRTPVNDIFYAQNLWLPVLLQRTLLNFNFHGVHHRNPSLPWSVLPAAFRQQR
jgi:fatty acid desaturase